MWIYCLFAIAVIVWMTCDVLQYQITKKTYIAQYQILGREAWTKSDTFFFLFIGLAIAPIALIVAYLEYYKNKDQIDAYWKGEQNIQKNKYMGKSSSLPSIVQQMHESRLQEENVIMRRMISDRDKEISELKASVDRLNKYERFEYLQIDD